MMKSKQKGALVKDDEKYLEGINLITGDKIDYSRNIMSESEISLLCFNENLPKIDKFLHIFSNGEKIQKWSLFENLTLYISNVQAAQTIFNLIQKNYVQYEEFINIMGEGIWKYMQKCKKCYDAVYRIMLRTLTSPKFQGSELLSDWMMLLNIYFKFSAANDSANQRKSKLSEIKQFLNGSFLMNTLPQRRKTALQMINSLIQQSQQISTQAQSKVLFFNSDLNPSTRKVICSVIYKILVKQSIPQIWKCVSDYYYKDKSTTIKEKAFQIMSTIHYGPNAEHIFQEFDTQDAQSRKIMTKYSPKVLKTFQRQLKSQSMYQLKIFSFLNRLLVQNMQANLQTVIQCFSILTQFLPQSMLITELSFSKFQLESMIIIKDLVKLYNLSSHIQFRDQIKKQVLKGLRYHEFYLNLSPKDMPNVIDIFDLSQIEDINIFILMLGQQIDFSKWKNVLAFLDRVPQIRFYQSHLEKMISNILKLYINCPYFLLQKVHQAILQLVLVDRKNMDVYIKIRQKCLGSKNWMLRRNFIKMYTYFKMNASYELNKAITPLVYKNIVNQKNILIKMEFTDEFYNAYSYLDPNNAQEKIFIKEVITRFAQDKDKELSNLAKVTLEMMKQVDKDFELITERMLRNKEIYDKEIMLQQVQAQIKKHIKTEKLISKESKELREKPKKGSLVQAKTAANLQKPNHIDKNKIMPEVKQLIRSTSTQTKKDIQKLVIPNPTKKSRF